MHGLAGTELLNPGLVMEETSAYLVCKDGSRLYIRNHTTGIQLFMNAEGCLMGQHHLLLRTAHGVAKAGSMACTFCCCKGDTYTGQALAPSKDELAFIATLKATQLDVKTCWQVAAWWWQERKAQIDACIYPVKLYVQVDGTKHTRSFRGKQVPATIKTDVSCCVAAWEAGVNIMRIHHEDVSDTVCVLDAVASVQEQQCIVLSPSFSAVKWKQAGGAWQTYELYLSARLQGCEVTYRMCGNIVFTHKKQQK